MDCSSRELPQENPRISSRCHPRFASALGDIQRWGSRIEGRWCFQQTRYTIDLLTNTCQTKCHCKLRFRPQLMPKSNCLRENLYSTEEPVGFIMPAISEAINMNVREAWIRISIREPFLKFHIHSFGKFQPFLVIHICSSLLSGRPPCFQVPSRFSAFSLPLVSSK